MPRMRSLAELRAELERREKEISKLLAKRSDLIKQLASMDRRIQSLGGEVVSAEQPAAGRAKKGVRAAARGRRGGKGKAKGKSLVRVIQDVLKGSDGMRVREIVDAVQKAGYRSVSKDFYGIVAATVRNPKLFKKLGRGVYKLAE